MKKYKILSLDFYVDLEYEKTYSCVTNALSPMRVSSKLEESR